MRAHFMCAVLNGQIQYIYRISFYWKSSRHRANIIQFSIKIYFNLFLCQRQLMGVWYFELGFVEISLTDRLVCFENHSTKPFRFNFLIVSNASTILRIQIIQIFKMEKKKSKMTERSMGLPEVFVWFYNFEKQSAIVCNQQTRNEQWIGRMYSHNRFPSMLAFWRG